MNLLKNQLCVKSTNLTDLKSGDRHYVNCCQHLCQHLFPSILSTFALLTFEPKVQHILCYDIYFLKKTYVRDLLFPPGKIHLK